MSDRASSLFRSYVAGLFDGEGSVMLRSGGSSETQLVVVTIANKYKPILDSIQLSFGGRVEIAVPGTQCWRWISTDKTTSRMFLGAVLPYLAIRKQEAGFALAILQLNGRALTDRELLFRLCLREKLKKASDERRNHVF